MTEISASEGLVEDEERRVCVNSNVNNTNDNNNKNNVIALQLDEYGEKVTGRVVVDTRDNWIARCLYGEPIALTVNFTILIAITLHFALTIGAKLEDKYFYEECFKKIWLRHTLQALFFLLPLNIVNTGLLVLVVFPFSRLSRSTFYYWLLGVSMSSLMCALLSIPHLFGIETMIVVRLIAASEWLRMSMKVGSFLVECNRSEEVFDASSIKTLLYFIFIPHLVYKHEYPRSRRIRWIKVVSHIWWLWIVFMPVHAILFPLVPYFLVDITTFPLTIALGLAVVEIFFGPFGFIILNQFTVFENYCGLHGELLRFPNLKTFGGLRKMFQGARAPHQVNIIVSTWLRTYLFKTLHKVTGSLFASILFTFTVSYIFHDIVFLYMLRVSLLPIAIIVALIHTLLMGIQASSRILQILHALLFHTSAYYWIALYYIEYLARNYSSIPGVEKEPILRLVPLSLSVLIKRITGEASFQTESFSAASGAFEK